MLELLGPAMSITTAALLARTSLRIWKAENKFLKWGGTGLAAFFSAAVSLISVIMIVGLFKLYARSAPALDLKVASTPEKIVRGHAISDGFCSGCHSKTGTLTGGLDVAEDLPVPIGSFVASNLTPAGQLSHWSDGEIFQAIRNGVDRDGHWLIMMSYTNAGKLSDDDTAAVIAYLRSLPAAGKQTDNPPDHLNLLGVVMLGAGMLPRGKPVSTGMASESANRYPNGPFFWNEVASGFIEGLVARHTSEFERRTRSVLGKDVLKRLRDYVVAHIDEPIEVSTLAKIAGRSPFHFTRLFTRSVGVSPHRYVVHLRLQRAVELVREGRSGLAEVAVCTGFADQSHLTRWVRRVHGVSLTELVA
jgi:AraC-like DNA-binding protein/mono/diheme cytochrome c family protein